MRQLLWTITFVILINDVITENMTSVLTNKTDQENGVTKVKITYLNIEKIKGFLFAMLINIYTILFLLTIFCIIKMYYFLRELYAPLKHLWHYFVIWISRVFLRTRMLEIPVRVQEIPNEMELVYINQEREEICNLKYAESKMPPNEFGQYLNTV